MRWFCRNTRAAKQIRQKRPLRDEAATNSATRRRGPQPLFVEHGPAGISGRQRLRARFTQCSICALMKDLSLYGLMPAMCHLDYTMSRRAKQPILLPEEYTLSLPAGRTATAATSGNLPRSTDQIAEKLGAFSKNCRINAHFQSVTNAIFLIQESSNSRRFFTV